MIIGSDPFLQGNQEAIIKCQNSLQCIVEYEEIEIHLARSQA